MPELLKKIVAGVDSKKVVVGERNLLEPAQFLMTDVQYLLPTYFLSYFILLLLPFLPFIILILDRYQRPDFLLAQHSLSIL